MPRAFSGALTLATLFLCAWISRPILGAEGRRRATEEPEEPSSPLVVFVIGEREYQTATTLPRFSSEELEGRGLRCACVHASASDPDDFPGIDVVDKADLLVLSVRRRTPPPPQLARIRRHLEAGKPLVGIRTASHAFDRDPPRGHVRWAEFDREVLGHHYEGHYGNAPGKGPRTLVRIADGAAPHAILEGIPRDVFPVASHLYRVRSLERGAKPLLIGSLEGREEEEPVALTYTYRGGRIFYTSLGHPKDFELQPFRRLLLNAIFWALDRSVPSGAREPAPEPPPTMPSPRTSGSR